MPKNPITPMLWFHTTDGTLASVFALYSKVFRENFSSDPIIPLGKTPSGNTEMATVHIFETAYSFMATEQLEFAFNESFSLILSCKDQNEIDYYWNAFVENGGKESQCGWCKDMFGVSWQIIPENLSELMQTPNAFEIMMKQKKIIISEYL